MEKQIEIKDKIEYRKQAPQKKTKKRKRNVFDQKEHFKISLQPNFNGPAVEGMTIYKNPNAVKWQDAVACIAELGVNMKAFSET